MAFKLTDRAQETATTTGAGSFTLGGAVSGFVALSSLYTVNTDFFFYVIRHQAANEWELGYGRLTAASTLERTQILKSTNADAAVSFSAGTKNVFVDAPASLANAPGSMLYGNGADGDVAVSTSIALTRDMYYANLTAAAGGTINTAGYKIFVAGVLDVTAADANFIQRNGTVGGTGGNGSGGTGGAAGAAGAALAAGTTGGSASGGAGAVGVNAGNSNGNTGAAGSSQAAGNGGGRVSAGSTDADGGDVAFSAFVGGDGGALGDLTVRSPIHRIDPHTIAGVTLLGGGAGGGGAGSGAVNGSGSGSGGGGGGGAGGGVVQIFARVLKTGGSTPTGTFSANGGTGGVGGTGSNGGALTGSGGGGGGNGGGGGWVRLVAGTKIGAAVTGLARANSGAGGNGGSGSGFGGGGGNGGGNCNSGTIDYFDLSARTTSQTISSSNGSLTGGASGGIPGGTGAAAVTSQLTV